MPHMSVKTRVSRNIQRIRREKDLSQEEVAHRAGIHQTYLSGVETGKRNPSILVVERIAVGLGVDVSEIFKAVRVSPDTLRTVVLSTFIGNPQEIDMTDIVTLKAICDELKLDPREARERLRAAASDAKAYPELAKARKPRTPWQWVKGSAAEKESRRALQPKIPT